MIWLLLLIASAALAQPPGARPQFEVASIRPCNPNGGGRGGASPDRFNATCGTVEMYIRSAYGASGQVFNRAALDSISNLPDWAKTERFTIDAKAPEQTSPAIMRGPMLQALLEDRFKLKLHRETREVAVYNLTIAKSGLKIQPRAPDSCTAPPGQKVSKPCAGANLSLGPTSAVEFFGVTMPDLALTLRNLVERPVIDKTALAGIYDVPLRFSPDPPAGASPANYTGPSIFTALEEQLGLKLESGRGPHEFLVVDNVERPSEN